MRARVRVSRRSRDPPPPTCPPTKHPHPRPAWRLVKRAGSLDVVRQQEGAFQDVQQHGGRVRLLSGVWRSFQDPRPPAAAGCPLSPPQPASVAGQCCDPRMSLNPSSWAPHPLLRASIPSATWGPPHSLCRHRSPGPHLDIVLASSSACASGERRRWGEAWSPSPSLSSNPDTHVWAPESFFFCLCH